MKKPGWWVRLKLSKKLETVKRDHKLHRALKHHLSCSLELSKIVLQNHSGFNGVRYLLRDLKQPIDDLSEKERKLKNALKTGSQLAE